jgi:hypothetical protein
MLSAAVLNAPIRQIHQLAHIDRHDFGQAESWERERKL